MEVKRLETEWLSYRAEVIPNDAPPVQLAECQRAFYGGALSLFKVVMTMLDPGAEPTEADLQKMTELQNELMAYGLSQGAFKSGGRG